MNIFYKISKTQQLIQYIQDRFWAFFIKRSMGHCGKNVMIKPTTSVFKGLENFYIEDDVHIPEHTRSHSGSL